MSHWGHYIIGTCLNTISNGNTSTWEQRIRRICVTGRIHNVNFVAFPECFYLRVLIIHVKNATSFEVYSTYNKACLTHGLEFNNKQRFDALEESALSKIPSAIRVLFA